MQITKETIKEYNELRIKSPILRQKAIDVLEKVVEIIGLHFDEPDATVDIESMDERHFVDSLYWIVQDGSPGGQNYEKGGCQIQIKNGDKTSAFLAWVGNGYFPVGLLFKTIKQLRQFLKDKSPEFTTHFLMDSIGKKLSEQEKIATGFYNA